MRVARLARAPVLMVGDIERGGVFASLVGTLAILPPADRRRIRGALINRFRGDARLLAGGLRDFRRRTGLPVVGVVPYLADLRLPEEDSVGLGLPEGDSVGLGQGRARALRLAVVRLPHMANVTDFAPLQDEPGVELTYAVRPEDLGGAHLVVLPGSKDTIADLRWLKAQGLARAVTAHARSGGAVLGICGGSQMLGRLVSDPLGVESGGHEAGLGLLPLETRLGADKTTRRVTARWLPGGPEVPAYEIHMGITQPSGGRTGLRPLFRVDGRAEGWAHPRRRIWGTYLHGLFEAPASRRRLLCWARGARVQPLVPRDHRQVREAAYERLADALETSVDPGWLARLLRA
jgi:adenosylcobyric acid synthase